jgi:hypothetical protein
LASAIFSKEIPEPSESPAGGGAIYQSDGTLEPIRKTFNRVFSGTLQGLCGKQHICNGGSHRVIESRSNETRAGEFLPRLKDRSGEFDGH